MIALWFMYEGEQLAAERFLLNYVQGRDIWS